MRKINFDSEQFLKDTIGEKGIKELGLTITKENQEEDINSTEINQEDKKRVFISKSEWIKLKLPLPTF